LVNPLNVYGKSKAQAEKCVRDACASALMIRTSAFFGPWDEHNFATLLLRVLTYGGDFIATDDYVISPTYVPDLVHLTLDLLIDNASGLWHIANQGEVTWLEFAQQILEAAQTDSKGLVGRPSAEMGWTAPRPKYSALSTERSLRLPALSDAIARYFQDRDCHLEGFNQSAREDLEEMRVASG
jgi:dTDP-4-dehydrorhamnose reductase